VNITPIETKCRHGYYVSYVCLHCVEAKAQAEEITRLQTDLATERAKVKAWKGNTTEYLVRYGHEKTPVSEIISNIQEWVDAELTAALSSPPPLGTGHTIR